MDIRCAFNPVAPLIKRYRGALKQSGVPLGRVWEDITKVQEALKQDPKIWSMMVTGKLTLRHQQKVVKGLCQAFQERQVFVSGAQGAIENFLLLLVKNRRLSRLPKLLHQLKESEASSQILHFFWCDPVGESLKEDLKPTLEALWGRPVDVRAYHNPELRRGWCIAWSGKWVDRSLKGFLNKIK